MRNAFHGGVQQVKFARQIVNSGPIAVGVVSLGAEGWLLFWRKGCERLRTPTVSIDSGKGYRDMSGLLQSKRRPNK